MSKAVIYRVILSGSKVPRNWQPTVPRRETAFDAWHICFAATKRRAKMDLVLNI